MPSAPSARDGFLTTPPAISLPKGGGAIRGMGEKFSANPVTGTASMSIPIPASPGRNDFGPQLALAYDSGVGNEIFGLGWSLAMPSIARKTDKGLPRYHDAVESDVFILAGAEDLVPELDDAGARPAAIRCTVYGQTYWIRRYRPRVEGLFALIERWEQDETPSNVFWRTISRDNVTSWFGLTVASRIVDPADNTRIFEWKLCETYSDKGDVAVYEHAHEDAVGVATSVVEESNRASNERAANRYPKKILYGNVQPYFPTLDVAPGPWMTPGSLAGQAWTFQIIFDYGDHNETMPTPTPDRVWAVREDPFSSHRSAFEVRTYRLCRRVLMFHHFPAVPGRADAVPGFEVPCLVRSTDFEYDEPTRPTDPQQPGYTVLRSITHRSYQRKPDPAQGYDERARPPVTFRYSVPSVDRTVRAVPSEGLENLPVGTHGAGYQWLDLDGEGLSGVLAECDGAWYYKRGLGDGRFGAMQVMAQKPAMAAPGSRQELIDLGGDGAIDLVDFDGPTPGFHERDAKNGWTRLVPFASLPNIDWRNPNLRFVDLTGDGQADVLITEQDVLTWHPSLEKHGFGDAQRTHQPRDEASGPCVVFADSTETIFLADMSGDGLTDLVRVRNGEVCYWPNAGYGRFGRKVTLGNSPRFDHVDLYDARRIRLADIDGSGPADIIYLGGDGARLYFNRSGNNLSDPLQVDLPAATENLAAVQVADLLGNGTACLVWSSHLPADARHPARYIDLMTGKPHLLVEVNNNLGGVTEIEYAPSTRFYVQDRMAGRPWITRLPFPVHCVHRITRRDAWRGTAFSSTYTYHHGYFDGIEREFRGFGRVEQTDVEHYGAFLEHNGPSPFITADKTLYQPPVRTITWRHTGAALERRHILDQFADEYFPARFTLQGFVEKPLPEPELPPDLTTDEWREALRACKGMVLRQEIYELDVNDLAATPSRDTPVRLFSAATHNCHIERLQPRGRNRHAVFLVTESESLSYQYELMLPAAGGVVAPDPRVTHTLNLRHDKYGNLEQSVAVGYARFRTGVPDGVPPAVPRPDLIAQVQSEQHVTYTETRYTEDTIIPKPPAGARAVRHRRLCLPCEVRTYEILGLPKPAARYFDITELRRHALCEDATYPPVVPPGQQAEPLFRLEYHEQPRTARRHRRIVEHTRTLFFQDEDGIAQPTASHALGTHGPRGLKYEEYKLALTDGLLNAIFQRRDANGVIVDDKLALTLDAGGTPIRQLLDAPAIGGYVLGAQIGSSVPGEYWMRSGNAGFAIDAAAHFYLPEAFRDPFDNPTTITYDARDLFVESSVDARGNTSLIARFDYRVLAPAEVVDVNGNHTEAAFDILGLVVAAAIKGKQVGGAWQGDHLGGFTHALLNPDRASVIGFCTSPTQDDDQARIWLGNSTTRFVYHFGEKVDAQGRVAWGDRMSGACAIARERHAGQLASGETSTLQISLECSDAGGNVLMKKVQAEPDPVTGQDRWVVNGLTVLNNKGNPVRQYEPAFTARFGCERPQTNGVSTTTYYDAANRVIRVEMPDGTFSRVEFSPWHVQSFDANDTVVDSAWYRERLTAQERQVPVATADPREQQKAMAAPAEDKMATRLAARHRDTPSLTLLDSLGRDVIAVAHNRVPEEGSQWETVALVDRDWRDVWTLTFTKLDAEGKPLWIRDAHGNLVMQYITPPRATADVGEAMPTEATPCYDVAGNLLFQHSMDAGDRWMLADAVGRPMLAWDDNQRKTDAGPVVDERRLFHTRYDELHRPAEQWLRIGADPRALVEAFEYVDTAVLSAADLEAAQRLNLIGQAVKHYDPSGLATVERVDFKGAVEEVTRTLVADAVAPVVDWNTIDRASLLETETFRRIAEHDALGRVTTAFNWHVDIAGQPGASTRVAVSVPSYNRRGLLESEALHVRAAKQTVNGRAIPVFDPRPARNPQAITRCTWDAKGQKLTLALGNGTTTRYTYDPQTFRLTHLYTRRDARFTSDCAGDPDVTRPPRACGVQNLHYHYDPVGNITHVQDDAQDTIWFANQQVEPSGDYVYDALYRLVEATGRENVTAPAPPRHREGNWPQGAVPSPDATRLYAQRYRYDDVGNITRVQHIAGAGSWTRDYAYAFDDPAQPPSNRLWQTWDGGDRAQAVTYRHDPHGNMLNLERTAPGLDVRWDWRDMIRALDLGGGGWAYYSYDIDRQRRRKRLERNGGATEDRIYLDGYEIYRRRDAQGVLVEEIESLHLFEGQQRVLLVDDVLIAKASAQPGPNGLRMREQTLFRYQYSNHLGSVATELDDQGQVISHEEFHPYGTTAYRIMDTAKETPAKRYRYTGMERDEESGLSYHRARYYIGHIARWAACDPVGTRDGLNLYAFVLSNPVRFIDSSGTQHAQPGESQADAELAWKIHQLKVLHGERALAAGAPLKPLPAGFEPSQAPTVSQKKVAPGSLAAPFVSDLDRQLASEQASSDRQLRAAAFLAGVGVTLIAPEVVVLAGLEGQTAAAVLATADVISGGLQSYGETGKVDVASALTGAVLSRGLAGHGPVQGYASSIVSDAERMAAARAVTTTGAAQQLPVGLAPRANAALGLPNRDVPEILEIAKTHGVEFPENVRFRLVPDLEKNTGALAKYGPDVPIGETVFYDNPQVPSGSLVTYPRSPDAEGSILIRIDPKILESDELLVATLAHEKYEIGQLQSIFLNKLKGNGMAASSYAKLIGPDLANLHDMAWEYAGEAVNHMRLAGPFAPR